MYRTKEEFIDMLSDLALVNNDATRISRLRDAGLDLIKILKLNKEDADNRMDYIISIINDSISVSPYKYEVTTDQVILKMFNKMYKRI
jgi:hypothetical protein